MIKTLCESKLMTMIILNIKITFGYFIINIFSDSIQNIIPDVFIMI